MQDVQIKIFCSIAHTWNSYVIQQKIIFRYLKKFLNNSAKIVFPVHIVYILDFCYIVYITSYISESTNFPHFLDETCFT